MTGLVILVVLAIAFMAGVGFREIADGVTRKVKDSQSLADKEEYFKIFEDNCKSMHSLSEPRRVEAWGICDLHEKN